MLNSRGLGSLFAPRSVAVVGASRDEGKWGFLLARGALKGAHRRSVRLVNRGGGEILGAPAFASLADLPEPPELVVVSVPAAAFAEAADEALAAGARAIVGISAGLGADEERAVATRVREAGAVLLGPNCLGVLDRGEELELAPWADFPAGDIGLIAQSGNLSLELALLAEREGLGFSRFASLGNQADLEAAELVADFARHEPTRLIALYVEDFRDGRAFARAAAEANKPVVLLTGGGSDAGRRAARSHTRALVSDIAVVDAACRAAGVVRVSTPRELVDAAKALLRGRPLAGRRVVVMGDGGGHGVVAADVATAAGLTLPVLSAAVASRLAEVLPETAATDNPVDFAGAAEQDVRSFERVARIVADSGEADALLVTGYFGGYGTDAEQQVAAALAELHVVVHSLFPDALALPLVYREIESAVRALDVLSRPAGPRTVAPWTDLELPPSAEGYFASRELAVAAGIPFAEARPASTLDEALAAAGELGYPVVLKSLASSHKSAGGGVVLGIGDAGALAAAYRGGEYSVERMVVADGVELIVGVRRDPRFGPVLLVGAGGVHTELQRDVALALAPVGPGEAAELIRSLRCAPLLEGLDLAAAAEAAAALSRVSAPWLAELELNPLLVTRDGVLALDARLVSGTMET